VPLIRRPTWDPLPDPPGLDPATLQEFQVLAAEHMSGVEGASDATGSNAAALFTQATDAEKATDAIGNDLAAGTVELEAMRAEAAADTLIPELQAASEQDAALAQLANEVADSLDPGIALPHW